MSDKRALKAGGKGALAVWRRGAERRGEDVLEEVAKILTLPDLGVLIRKLEEQAMGDAFVRYHPERLIQGLPSDWEDWCTFNASSHVDRWGGGCPLITVKGWVRMKRCPQDMTSDSAEAPDDGMHHPLFSWSTETPLDKGKLRDNLLAFCLSLAYRRECESQGLVWGSYLITKVPPGGVFCISEHLGRYGHNYHGEISEGWNGDYTEIEVAVAVALSDVRRIEPRWDVIRGDIRYQEDITPSSERGFLVQTPPMSELLDLLSKL